MEHSNAYHPAVYMTSSYAPSPAPVPAQGYMQEIEALRQELLRKDQELQKLRSSPGIEHYNKVNKDMYDRQQSDIRKRETTTALDAQLNQRHQLQLMEARQRGTEQARRLEELRKLREEEMKAQAERLERARAYKQDLDVQAQLKERLRREEDHYIRKEVPRIPAGGPPIPMHQYSQSGPSDPFQVSATAFYEPETKSPMQVTRYAKITPKTMSFNPITGELRDTSNLTYQPPIHKQMNPFMPEKKNQERIAADFATLSAFQQPKFTKLQPRVKPSFPMTGYSQLNNTNFSSAFKEDTNKFFGLDDRQSRGQLADYGSIMLRPSYIR